MTTCARTVGAILRPLIRQQPLRTFASTANARAEVAPATVETLKEDPEIVNDLATIELEKEVKAGRAQGKRVRTLEDMPFQTYQLALEVIRQDREEKLEAIALQRRRIESVTKCDPDGPEKEKRLKTLRDHLEYLKIQADINSPRVKYNFENGKYTLDKPVYRFLAEQKWRGMPRKILMQRITQMNVVPDVIPAINPVVDVQMRFRGVNIQPGRILPSTLTERQPTLKIIPFRPGEKLYTVIVVDPDVPDIENDSFTYKLMWMVSNISTSHLHHQALGTGARPSDTIYPYQVPTCQKGIPYHRLALFVFEQPEKLDAEALKAAVKPEGFNTRSFMAKNKLKAVGVNMWRNEWDATMKEVMQRNNIEGWDKMFVRKKD